MVSVAAEVGDVATTTAVANVEVARVASARMVTVMRAGTMAAGGRWRG